MNIPLIGSGTDLTMVLKDDTYTVSKTDPKFGLVIQTLKDHRDDPNLEELLLAIVAADKSQLLATYSGGKVEVREDGVFYQGLKLENVVCEKIIEFATLGLPFDNMVKFLENLLANPSYSSIQQLYAFLERVKLPITEDGCFLAYKGVNSDYTSKHRGTGGVFNNSPGNTCQMERSQVQDDPKVGCGQGLHAGSLNYATDFAGDGKVVCVKINPKDVVSVPLDCNQEKLRTCYYEVLSDITEQCRARREMLGYYSASGEQIDSLEYYEDDGDWEEIDSYLDDEDDETPVREVLTRQTGFADDEPVLRRDHYGRFSR